MPKIPQDSIPHRAVFEPQLAEQLVEVATAVTFVPGSALFVDRHGHDGARVPGPTGVHFWNVATNYTQWELPERYTASSGRCTKILGKVDDVPVNMHDKFPQSWPIDNGLCLRFSSSADSRTPVLRTPEIPQGSSWMVVDAPVVCDNRCRRWSRQFSLSPRAMLQV